jgi:hypothetical protein
MLFATVFATMKLALTTLTVKVSVPTLESRVADAISTSEGEFVRVGTLLSNGPESSGKMWYNSTSTCVMLPSGVPNGTNPVMVAWVISVLSDKMKSSAVSVSILPALAGRDSAPNRPSGAPALKENVAAHAGWTKHTAKDNVAVTRLNRNLMAILRNCL